MPSDLIEEEGNVDSSDIDPQVPITIRRVPTSYRGNTFSNEIRQDKEVPMKRCAVCCRLLYKEEYCGLLKRHQKIIEEQFARYRSEAVAKGAAPESVESMNWPLLGYRDESGVQISELDLKTGGKDSGCILVCARHKSRGSQDLSTIISYVS
jgi:hypothetical protein